MIQCARCAVLCVLLAVPLVSCAAAQQVQSEMVSGRLKPCPDKPNCVCSEDRGKASWVEPLAFEGPPETAWKRLGDAVRDIGGRIEKDQDGYLSATFRTRFLRFVDDMEFRMDAANEVIHLRSASRIGYSDFGVNRRRAERLRARFHQTDGDRQAGDVPTGNGE
jgi:uncharacterized protein (DUF1499 family)